MNNFKKNIYRTENIESTIPPTFSSWHFSNPGRSSSGLACSNTSFINTWYAAYTGGIFPAIGATMYSDSALTSPIVGGDLWFNLQEAFLAGDPIVYQISNSGVISNFFSCP